MHAPGVTQRAWRGPDLKRGCTHSHTPGIVQGCCEALGGAGAQITISLCKGTARRWHHAAEYQTCASLWHWSIALSKAAHLSTERIKAAHLSVRLESCWLEASIDACLRYTHARVHNAHTAHTVLQYTQRDREPTCSPKKYWPRASSSDLTSTSVRPLTCEQGWRLCHCSGEC